MTPFAFPTFKIYSKSTSYLLVIACLSCIKFPQDLHNTAFDIVFLPHGSFLLDGFSVICHILLTITFVFTRFTFSPLSTGALIQLLYFSCSSAMVFAIKTMSSTYNISCNVPTFISSEQHQSQWQTTVVIKLIPGVLQRLPQTLQINVFQLSLLSGTFVLAHHFFNLIFWNTFPCHCPFHNFPRNSIKCFFLIYKERVQLLLLSYVFFLYPPKNKDLISCTFTWQKVELHIIYRKKCSHSFLKYLFKNIHCMF